MKLTAKEAALLKAFWTNEYVDGEERPTPWTFSVTDYSGLAKKAAPGVFASLVEKKLIEVAPREKEGYNSATPTQLGFETARDLGLIVNAPTSDGRAYWKGSTSTKETTTTLAEEKKMPTATKKSTKSQPSRSPARRAARAIVRRYLRAATELAYAQDVATSTEYSADDLAAIQIEYERADAALGE